jgi:hypothetical protein
VQIFIFKLQNKKALTGFGFTPRPALMPVAGLIPW